MTSKATAGELVLRPAESGDVVALESIERETFPDPWSRAAFTSALRHDNTRVAVAARNDRVIGYSVAIYAADEGELANIAVVAHERGNGVGAALLDDVIREGRRRGAHRLFLEVRAGNLAAKELYRKAGFREVSRRRRYYSDPVEDAIVMTWDASDPVDSSG